MTRLMALAHSYQAALDDFQLDGQHNRAEPFELESVTIDREDTQPQQVELCFPESNSERSETTAQIELDGMTKPRFAIQLSNGQHAVFQHAQTLLESLESQQVDVHFQCRQGYCGSCRVQLLNGDVHYREEPMAWLNKGDILPCCCIPKSDLKIKL